MINEEASDEGVSEDEAADKVNYGDLVIQESVKGKLVEVEKRKVVSHTATEPVDFMRMDSLEKITDPHRRPSINMNDEILPLPARQIKRRQNRRISQGPAIESLVDEMVLTDLDE